MEDEIKNDINDNLDTEEHFIDKRFKTPISIRFTYTIHLTNEVYNGK
ncbi:MAG: hypothetical protein LBC64_09220 [Fibromonadaceae bacterium]|jgi:hypothetical protein|nr:hypothetical protein [Fibromonadaceae bacterium]